MASFLEVPMTWTPLMSSPAGQKLRAKTTVGWGGPTGEQ